MTAHTFHSFIYLRIRLLNLYVKLDLIFVKQTNYRRIVLNVLNEYNKRRQVISKNEKSGISCHSHVLHSFKALIQIQLLDTR